MSTNTTPTGTYKDLIDPETFLDARAAAILMRAGQEGISGWIFDIPTGEDIELNSDITDHFTESGSFATDHMVLKPIQVTLTGLRGELFYAAPKAGSLEAAFAELGTLLGVITAYLGPLTPQAAQKGAAIAGQAAYVAKQAGDIKKRASNLIKYFSGDDNSQTLQQKAFADISSMWRSKQIVTVQTPWGFFGNMAISGISVRQDANSNDYTDFSITLKEMRFVDIQITTFDAGEYTSAIDAQAAPANNIGQTQGAGVDNDSALYKAIAVPLLGAK